MNKIIKYIILYTTILQGILMSASLQELKYKNKIIPIVFEKHKTLPIFNLQLVFQNSGYIQDKEKKGLAKLTSKFLNEGTKKDGAVIFARKLENRAISIHASTGFETFVIEISCLKSEYKQAFFYLNQLLKDPNITNSTLKKLKILQISKLKQKENDYDYLAKMQLKNIIFKDTPLEDSSSGNIKSVNKITLKDIKKHIETTLNIDNLIVVTGGNISIKEIKKELLVILQNLKSGGKTKLKHFKLANNIQEKVLKKDTQQAYIYFGSNFNISSKDKNIYKAKVASFILGGSGFGSRFMEEIRVKRGLAYSAYGHISISKTHSYFTGYLQTKLENQDKAKKLVVKLINGFVKNGVTNKELESAKKFLLGSEPLRTETFSQRLNRAFNLYYKNLPQDYPAKELKLIEQLKLEDINKFIRSHKEIKNLSFSIVSK